MITAFVALLFYIVDPLLGIVLALVLPSVLALDTDGSYGQSLLVLLLAVAVYFVRAVAFKKDED
jgi:hypothetical protein